MNLFTKQPKLNQSGVSLLEVLASTILIAILLLSFYTMLISSAKTTKTAETIIDYTYLAQKEMENLYEKSNTSSTSDWNDIKNHISSLGYVYLEERNGYTIFKNTMIKENVYILIKIKMHDPTNYTDLTNVIIEVYDAEKSVQKSKMETILLWGD